MRKEEIQKLIGLERMPEFEKFMCGQTVEIKEDGSINYYKDDVRRFMCNLPVVD